MDKIKRPELNLSLRKSLVLYIVIFVILALILSISTNYICESAVATIQASYPPSGEKYYLTNEQGERLGDGAYIGNVPVIFSEKDERTIALLELLPVIATPVYSALCIIAAVLLFYKNKLRNQNNHHTTSFQPRETIQIWGAYITMFTYKSAVKCNNGVINEHCTH